MYFFLDTREYNRIVATIIRESAKDNQEANIRNVYHDGTNTDDLVTDDCDCDDDKKKGDGEVTIDPEI